MCIYRLCPEKQRRDLEAKQREVRRGDVGRRIMKLLRQQVL